MDLVYSYLPQKLRLDIQKISREKDLYGLEEIRIRGGQRTQFIFNSGSLYGCVTDRDDIEEMLNYLCEYSWYRIAESLRKGFFTIKGGHRIGIAGRSNCQENRVDSLDDIGALNIRIAREKIGCADGILPYIRKSSSIHNTIIFSAPGQGKTTCLRDMIRSLSGGDDSHEAIRIGVTDERSEIAALWNGIPQNDLGKCTDVMDNCPKPLGMRMLLRSMSPQVIAVDELGRPEDMEILEEILVCGTKVLGTVHAGDIEEIREKGLPPQIERFVKVENVMGRRRYSVFDKSWRLLGSAMGLPRPDEKLEYMPASENRFSKGFCRHVPDGCL